MADILEASAY